MFLEELVIGEVYIEKLNSREFISKHVSESKSTYIRKNSTTFSTQGLRVLNSTVVRKATQEEKDWLEHCIKLNKFVSLEDFKKVDKLRFEVGKWYQCFQSKCLELD